MKISIYKTRNTFQYNVIALFYWKLYDSWNVLFQIKVQRNFFIK